MICPAWSMFLNGTSRLVVLTSNPPLATWRYVQLKTDWCQNIMTNKGMDFPRQNHVLVPKTSNAAWLISTSTIQKIVQFCTVERVPKSSNDVQTLTSQHFWAVVSNIFFHKFCLYSFWNGLVQPPTRCDLMLSEGSRWWDSTKKSVVFFRNLTCNLLRETFPKGAFF